MSDTAHPSPPVRVGDVLHLAEDDYRYGRGALVLRVTAIFEVWTVDGEDWVGLRGVPIQGNGYVLPERGALVRCAILLH